MDQFAWKACHPFVDDSGHEWPRTSTSSFISYKACRFQIITDCYDYCIVLVPCPVYTSTVFPFGPWCLKLIQMADDIFDECYSWSECMADNAGWKKPIFRLRFLEFELCLP